MKTLRLVLLFLLMALAGTLFYANRALLTSPYDAAYWKDRFEHSQWQLPLSTRILGDNGLYAYEGYQLMQGTDPTKYNAEIPPLGKYTIGAVIRLTGNGLWYGVSTSLLIWGLFFLVARNVLKHTTLSMAATAWLAFDPLLISQWNATMLDSLHLASLLLFFLLLDRSVRGKHVPFFLILTGIALGVFSSIKYPIFSVILFTAAQYYIWQKTRSVRNAVTFSLAAFLTYLGAYTRYFLLGHTFWHWLEVQKWMVAFWYNGRLQANTGSVWTTLLVNRYQNLFTKFWESVPEWSVAWPVVTLLSGLVVFRCIRQKQYKEPSWELIVGLSVTAILLSYTFIAFWTRYLLIILPFLYLGAAAVLRTLRNKTLLVVCIVGIVLVNGYTSWHMVFPTPEMDVRQFVYDWKNGFFQDMYERFTTSAKEENRYVFHRDMQRIMREGEIESIRITITPISWKQFTSPQYVPLEITYYTRNLGEFSQTIRLPVVREDGQWRIPWQSQYLISGFARGNTLTTTILPAKRGTIQKPDGQVLAEDVPGSMIWVTPDLVDTTKEQAMLNYLETIFGGIPRFSAVNFYHRYAVNSQPDWPVPIGVIPLDQPTQSNLLTYPGILLTPVIARFQLSSQKDTIGVIKNTQYEECCSFLYSTTPYRGISGLEQLYDIKLKGQNGGTLEILNNMGKPVQTLINKEEKDGEDILL